MDTRNSVINQATGIAVVAPLDDDVGDLEMLLESYFMQLDGIRNRIMMVCSSLPNLYCTHHTRPRHSLIMTVPILMSITIFWHI